MPVSRDESHQSAARFVGWLFRTPDALPEDLTTTNLKKLLHKLSAFSITKKPDLQTHLQFKASRPTNALTDETVLTLEIRLNPKAPGSHKPT